MAFGNRGYNPIVPSTRLQWLLFSYRLPREPSRLRLGAWRRLRRVGAVLLHETVWALPSDPKTREHFEWLAEEIEDNGGTTLIWQAESLSAGQERETVARFRAEAEARYREIAASASAIRRAATASHRGGRAVRLRHALRQLEGLQRAVRLERRRDYFRVDGRQQAEAAVRAAVAAVEERLSSRTVWRPADAVGNQTALSR